MGNLLIVLLSLVIGFLASFIAVGLIAATNSGLTNVAKPLVILAILFSAASWVAITAHESVADTAAENMLEAENLRGVLRLTKERRRDLLSGDSKEKLCLFETPDITRNIDTVVATIDGSDTTVFHLMIFKR